MKNNNFRYFVSNGMKIARKRIDLNIGVEMHFT
jgi:hypothetical protein